jgi:hypothetical protein
MARKLSEDSGCHQDWNRTHPERSSERLLPQRLIGVERASLEIGIQSAFQNKVLLGRVKVRYSPHVTK